MVALLLVVTVGLAATLRSRGSSRAAQTVVIVIENMKFNPAVITVRPGDTVEFRNADLVPHNVTEVKAGYFDSGMISPNGVWKFVTDRQGRFDYHCIYHPEMTGTIIVSEVPDSSSERSSASDLEICSGL